ncbi:MAG: YitT family protein [Butyrivibrio sp.]|nr:YitT family protein [Butyrivibrio sp.]
MNTKNKLNISEFLMMSFATLIIAGAVYFFLIPSKTSVSSISGLAIVVSNIIPFQISAITMFLNILLLIIGFLTCGNEFGIKTVYTSILLPVYLAIFEHIFPNFQSLTGSDALDVVCYIFTVSIGLAILFDMNASSGGLDIVAKVMNKYLHMDLGKAMSMSGMVVALSSALVYDKRSVVLSVLGTYLNGIVLDHFIFGRSIKRRVCIVSMQHHEEILKFIIEKLHSGASLYDATGAYTGKKHQEIITIVDKHEYQKLMDYIITVDPDAFVTIYNVSNMRYRIKPQS